MTITIYSNIRIYGVLYWPKQQDAMGGSLSIFYAMCMLLFRHDCNLSSSNDKQERIFDVLWVCLCKPKYNERIISIDTSGIRISCFCTKIDFNLENIQKYTKIISIKLFDSFHQPKHVLFKPTIIKTWISNLMRTTRFWNNLHQVRSKSIDWKLK